MRLSDFDHFARRHHGLITFAASGLSNDSWHRAIRSGSFIEVHRHVARLPGTEPTELQRIHAAVLAAGVTAMASHDSAAALWGLTDVTDPFVHLILSDPGRHPRLTTVAIHRPTDRQHLRPATRAGIPCTDPLRTLCDLGATSPRLVERAVDTALRSGLVTVEALVEAAQRHSRPGRAGTPSLRAAIATLTAPPHLHPHPVPM